MTDTSTDSGAGPVAGDDPVDLVPPWVRARGADVRHSVRRHIPGRLDLAALVLGLASLVPLTWLLLRGSFYIDDLRAQSYAAGRAWWPFVVQSNGTHLTPGARTIDWLQVTFAPLDHGVAVAITVGIRALLLLGAWRLLRLLFGARWLLLVPFTIIATTPALVPPSAWYRQSITALVAALALVWATDQHLRWLREPTDPAPGGSCGVGGGRPRLPRAVGRDRAVAVRPHPGAAAGCGGCAVATSPVGGGAGVARVGGVRGTAHRLCRGLRRGSVRPRGGRQGADGRPGAGHGRTPRPGRVGRPVCSAVRGVGR